MHRRRRIVAALSLVGACVAGPAHAGAQETKTLRIAIPRDDGSLTPYTFANGYAFMSLVYDTLMWRDAGGAPRPWLAQSLRRSASNPRIMRVTLRSGVRWHDGRPLTSADVAFSYRYFLQHRHPRFSAQLRDIAGVDVDNDSTVVFILRNRSLGFENLPLADVPIIPRHVWANLAPGRLAPAGLPVGSGPYRLVERNTRRGYRFAANRSYFRGRPSVDRIELPIVRTEAKAVDELRAGRLDAALVTQPTGSLGRRAGVEYGDGVTYAGTMLMFNVARAPFGKRAARRAVASSLDLGLIAPSRGGPARVALANHGMLRPGSPWAGDRVLQRSDVDAARVLFAEQGVGEFRILAARNDALRLETARRVVAAVRRAGGRARVLAASPREFERALGRAGAPASFDAAVVGIPALASYDPTYLQVVFGSTAAASLNDGGYRSARFEALAERISAVSSGSGRRRAVTAQLQLLADDLPAVPLFFGGGAVAYRPQAYDRWVPVTGTGILDKRSFLARAATTTELPPSAEDPLDTSGDGGGVSLLPLIAVLAVLFVAATVWSLRRARRS